MKGQVQEKLNFKIKSAKIGKKIGNVIKKEDNKPKKKVNSNVLT